MGHDTTFTALPISRIESGNWNLGRTQQRKKFNDLFFFLLDNQFWIYKPWMMLKGKPEWCCLFELSGNGHVTYLQRAWTASSVCGIPLVEDVPSRSGSILAKHSSKTIRSHGALFEFPPRCPLFLMLFVVLFGWAAAEEQSRASINKQKNPILNRGLNI